MFRYIYAAFAIPLSLLGLFVNLFYLFCMLKCGEDANRAFRQPVKLMFFSTVGFSMLFQVSECILVCQRLITGSLKGFLVLQYFLRWNVLSCMSSSVWLSIFYYSKIVPNQRPLFIWIRKNIKVIVYTGVIVDKVYTIMKCGIDMALNLYIESYSSFNSSLDNYTVGSQHVKVLSSMRTGFQIMHLLYLLSFIVMMSCSWGSMLVYLRKHMEKMKVSSSMSFASPQTQSQMRVVVTGLIQTAVYLICSVWILLCQLAYFQFDHQGQITHSILTLFVFISTINLGFSQSLFRQRAAKLFDRVNMATRLCQ